MPHEAGSQAPGGCACGAVRYLATGSLRPVIVCHCETCRRTSGHVVAATSVARSGLKIAGEVAWWASSDRARRGFCPVCGSSLFFDGGGERVSIHAGTLDGPTGLAVAGHIFAAEKGDYYAIGGETPVADGADPRLTTRT